MFKLTQAKDGHILVVDFTRRLPDVVSIDAMDDDLDAFGRFAILQSGMYWFGDIHSSFPPTIRVGFFWALSDNRLYVSPTGVSLDWEFYITEDTLDFLAEKLALKRRYREYSLVL
jgi:hypothetical protein